ncbi:MAG: hypothetical protein JWM15_597 [Cryptosporangiaceae bacterium]|nr:hypothetical protein [Cryptosporangiaceae bacterium]
MCGVTGWFRRNVVVAGAVLVLGASGCTGDSGKGPVDPPLPPSTPASPVPSVSPTGTAEDQILAQYRRFWTDIYPAVFLAPEVARRQILSPVVVDRLLSELLRIAGEFDRRNQQSTGRPVLSDEVVNRRAGVAVVAGCVDMTDVVLKDKSTGKVVDEGPMRAFTQTFFKVSDDGVWRAYALRDPPGARC